MERRYVIYFDFELSSNINTRLLDPRNHTGKGYPAKDINPPYIV